MTWTRRPTTWTPDRIRQLLALDAAGHPPEVIASKLGNRISAEAVKSRLYRLGLSAEDYEARLQTSRDRRRQRKAEMRRREQAAQRRPVSGACFGRCTAFRPLRDEDANRATRL